MKTLFFTALLFTLNTLTYGQSSKPPRTLAECTLTFTLSAAGEQVEKEFENSLQSTVKMVYIKGTQSRVDVSSNNFVQSVIYDKLKGSTVILREIGNNKFLTPFDKEAWIKKNAMYENATLNISTETKTILGYECKKAMLTLKDGSVFTLYFTSSIIPSVKEFEYQFKDIPGFVLEYEATDSKGRKIRYIATKINVDPVPGSKFIIPTEGYRLLQDK